MQTLRKKIGQMLIMGFSGSVVDSTSPVIDWLKKDGLGGVILFNKDWATKALGKNIQHQDQLKKLNHDLYECAQLNQAEPLIIAIDYEGGVVDRLRYVDGCMKTLTPAEQALLPDDALFSEAENMAKTLKSLGFNLNFAPVVDLNLNQDTGIIGKLGRSFSSDPQLVIRAAKQFISAFAKQRLLCCYKHFPGHGSASGDTHEGFVDVTDCFSEDELIPYVDLAKFDCSNVMVMTAHVINRKLDADGLPATLSYPILTQLLREKLGYQGIIISDDLQMQAISDHYSLDDSLSLTINAGADMLIFGNQLGNHTATEVIDRIERLVKTGVIKMQRIDEAYQRVLRVKQDIAV